MRFFFAERIEGDEVFFDKAEVLHIRKSLRKKIGDTIHVLDGRGSKYQCRIVEDGSDFSARIDEVTFCPPSPYRLSIAIAITKQVQRFEWFVEKAVELGISEIIPLVSARTEKARLKVERLRRIAISACKQSGNPHLPSIVPPSTLEAVIDSFHSDSGYIAHCEKNDLPYLGDVVTPNEKSLVLIGPEGDFTREEIRKAVQSGLREISLGNLRLRTETAGIYVTSLFANINQEK